MDNLVTTAQTKHVLVFQMRGSIQLTPGSVDLYGTQAVQQSKSSRTAAGRGVNLPPCFNDIEAHARIDQFTPLLATKMVIIIAVTC